MHKSRKKTLCALVAAAMQRCGTGVLALGRAMRSRTAAKHCIKRVWRFLRNGAVEVAEVHRAIFLSTRPKRGAIVVLADWTDIRPHKSLVLSLVRDGRSVPFCSSTVPVRCGKGGMAAVESSALAFLSTPVEAGREVIIVADRGFGHGRWIEAVESRGWSDGLKANTSKQRQLSLMNIGFHTLHRLKLSLQNWCEALGCLDSSLKLGIVEPGRQLRVHIKK